MNRRRKPGGMAGVISLLAAEGVVGEPNVQGTVRAGGDPVAGARVTLFLPDLSLFRETRTDPDGEFDIDGVQPGQYWLGVAAPGYGYSETAAVVPADDPYAFDLLPESHPGTWIVIGDTLPELFDATDIAVLLPQGDVFFCHDTVTPILFDPASGEKGLPSGSDKEQGCMNASLLPDGRLMMVGGQDGDDPGNFRNAIPWVKAYDRKTDSWEWFPDMQHEAGRWYPGLARLADGSFLVMGGGTAPNAERTDTCERFDLESHTWAYTGSMLDPCEFPPSALLYTGDVLATWSRPQLYEPASGQWRATGAFNQPDRGWPNHSDHSLILLADGRAFAAGIRTGNGGGGVMGEVYDPESETWSLTSNPDLIRFQCEVTQLPDGQVLVAAGETEDPEPPVEDILGIVQWSDLYNPATDTWRRMADLNYFREYHAVTVLVPDGRVVTTGGTRLKFQYGPITADIEAFSPPYLFRGVRPQIAGLSSAELARGQDVALTIFPETKLTSVVLMGLGSNTHWVDGGVPRRLVLPVSQEGAVATAMLPTDENLLPLGFYMLFAMVDDIPSAARIVQVSAAVCYPDFTGDGALDLFDFLAFVNAFNTDDPVADCDGDGDLDLFDFLCFVNAFNSGC
jgi:hypothetical protein